VKVLNETQAMSDPKIEDPQNTSGYLKGFTGMFKRIIKETATYVTIQDEQ